MKVELKLINTLSTKLSLSNSVVTSGGGGGAAIWGGITGNIEDQEDLIEYISGKGYLTEIPGEYVKREELGSYQPKGEYLTEIPSEYAKKSDLSGFITEIPGEYITETELADKAYATQAELTTALGDIETVLDNIIGS